ncbi:MAG: hypothetical protein RJQ14_07755 [Marinoscillum sp.]
MRIATPLLLLSLSYFSFAQSIGNSEELNQKIKAKYPLSTATVKYNISGDALGTAELHFDRNGWRSVEHKEITIERYGVKSTESTIELTDGDFKYQVNVDAGKGKKTTDKSWSGLLGYRTHPETIAAIMTSKGGQSAGEQLLLDKTCTVWTFSTGATREIWEWNGILLKVIKKLPGLSYEMIAQEILPIESINEELLILPKSLVWTD